MWSSDPLRTSGWCCTINLVLGRSIVPPGEIGAMLGGLTDEEQDVRRPSSRVALVCGSFGLKPLFYGLLVPKTGRMAAVNALNAQDAGWAPGGVAAQPPGREDGSRWNHETVKGLVVIVFFGAGDAGGFT